MVTKGSRTVADGAGVAATSNAHPRVSQMFAGGPPAVLLVPTLKALTCASEVGLAGFEPATFGPPVGGVPCWRVPPRPSTPCDVRFRDLAEPAMLARPGSSGVVRLLSVC